MEKTAKMVLALIIIIILTAVVIYATLPYLNYFFGAFILYIVFRPLHHFFVRKIRIRNQFSAALVIIISIFVVLIPLFFLMGIIVGEIQQLLHNEASIIVSIQSGGQFLNHYLSQLNISTGAIQTKIQERTMDIASDAVNYSSDFILGSIQNISHQTIGFLLMYFLLYYLLTGEDSVFAHKVYVAIPFNDENTATLMDEFRKIVRTTITSSGAVALVQGILLTITFLIFKIQGAILWGFIAVIVAFIPVFGSTLVWVPATIIQFLMKNYTAAISILATGLFMSVIDNILRPVIQKKVGKIHPFLSLLGIVIGVSLFGLIGIVIGPLLLSYFLLTIEMFSKEYFS
jgi:predicted PurR-regulated permease PerM